MEEAKVKKQKYLSQEIIGKNYDPEQFAAFLNNEKVNGSYIDNWSLEELITLVNIFKRKQNVLNEKDKIKYKLQEIEISVG